MQGDIFLNWTSLFIFAFIFLPTILVHVEFYLGDLVKQILTQTISAYGR